MTQYVGKQYEYQGKTQSLRDWAKEYSHPYKPFARRVRDNKWSIERALTQPYAPQSLVEQNLKKPNKTQLVQTFLNAFMDDKRGLDKWIREQIKIDRGKFLIDYLKPLLPYLDGVPDAAPRSPNMQQTNFNMTFGDSPPISAPVITIE